jgi:hypothetical protein
MAITVLQKDNAFVPFLSKPINLARGLDPLGLQNTSEQAYSMLLPGLNNVTGRIRYYSFYCWILTQYFNEFEEFTKKSQRAYIRYAEYLIALITQSNEGENAGRIPGIAYAGVKTEEQNSVFDLHQGTFNPDGSTRGTYWTTSSGAFGQYYRGALREIGIVNNYASFEGISAPVPSKEKGAQEIISGVKLAAAFDKNIQPNSKRIFLSALLSKSISQADLKELVTDFDLSRVPENSEETELLIKLLIQEDKPLEIQQSSTYFRKETLIYLLEFCKTEDTEIKINDRLFVIAAYFKRLKEYQKDCLAGWYFYQLNELWQFSCTAILNGCLEFLYEIHGYSGVPFSFYLKNLINKILIDPNSNTDFTKDKLKDFWKEVNDYSNAEDADEYIYNETIRQAKGIERTLYAIMLIHQIYLNNKTNLPFLKEYFHQYDLGRNDDFHIVNFLTELDKQGESNFESFLEQFLLKFIFYRHQYVALKKMTAGKSTQKFILEDGQIRYLSNFDPSFTGPRIGNLLFFLQDLNLLDAKNRITPKGEELYNNLKSTQNQ